MNAPNLVLHCGAAKVERTALPAVLLPAKTDTYCPIGHDTFVDLVEDRLADIGFRFGTQAHSLTKEGQRYFGLIQLLNGTSDSDEYALVCGLRNSIDKSFPAKIAFGSHVFVCDNLAFSGEIVVSRKHTTHIMRDLPTLVAAAVSNTKLMRDNQNQRFDFYKGFKLGTRTADHVICNLLREGAVNTSRLETVVKEWDEPSHDFGGRTAWRLFNAVTEALKGAPLHDMPTRTIILQSVIDQVTGFVPRIIEGEATRVN